jgi:hypothetical protein
MGVQRQMDDVKFRFESDGTSEGTKVFLNGKQVQYITRLVLIIEPDNISKAYMTVAMPTGELKEGLYRLEKVEKSEVK